MSNQITTAFVQQYSNNVALLSQQKGSLLRGTVDVESVIGKHSYFEQVGSVTAQKRVTRHSDTPQIDKFFMSIKNSVNCWKIFLRQSAAKLYNLKGI
jgi:hypothetical protein